MLPQRLKRWAAGILLVSTPLAHATDSLIGNVTGIRFPGNDGAYGGGLTLQHAGSAGGVLIGLNGMSFPVGTLTDLDLDGYRTVGALSITAGGSLGRAHAGGTSNTLVKGRLLLDFQVDGHWIVHAGDTYVHLARIEGQLLSAAAEYRFSAQWALKAGGGYALSGTLADRYGLAELNWFGRQHLFIGMVNGKTGYDPASLGQFSVVSRLVQCYSGASIPIGKGSLLLGLDNLALEGRNRQTFRIGFSRPIRP